MASPFPPQPQPLAAITPRVVPARAGATWWTGAWRIFSGSLPTWVVIMIVYFAISMLLDKVPHIGAFASWLLTPVFTGGLMLGCAAVDRGEPLRVAHLFDGFNRACFVSLLMIGVYDILMCVLAVIVGVVVLIAGVGTAALPDLSRVSEDPLRLLSEFGLTYFLLVILAIAVFAVLAMANWFAPALIVLHKARPLAAMMTSLRTSLRNWLPFLVFGLIGLGIFVVFGGLFAVVLGFIGFEYLVALFEGTASWKSVGFGIVSMVAVGAALLIAASSVYYGSIWASYRDTLAEESSAQGHSKRD